MRRLFLAASVALLATWIWTGALTFGIVTGEARADDSPKYLILQPMYGGQGRLVPARAYAYGWFGAIPTSDSSAHWDYHRTLYTWTFTQGR